MTIDFGTPTAVETGGRADDRAERILAETLAETAGVGSISIDSNFFDDLGLDSLMIAHFCARVRKQAKLPSISVKDCYQHPTIRGLAASLPEGASVHAGNGAAPAAEPTGRVRARGEYVLCGALQLLVFLAYASVAGVVFSVGYEWISDGSGWIDVYLRLGRGRRRELRRRLHPADSCEVGADRSLEARGDPDLEPAVLPLLARPHPDPGEPDGAVRRLAALPALPQGAGRKIGPVS